MAKHNQKKKRNKKYTGGRARTEAVRQDYRAGGRVGFAEGDVVIDPRTGRALPSTQDRTQQPVEPVQQPTVPVQQPAQQPIALDQIPEQRQPTFQDFQNLPSRENIPLPPPVVTQQEFSADDLQFLQNIARKGLPDSTNRGGLAGMFNVTRERYDELVRERGQEAVNRAMGIPSPSSAPAPTSAPTPAPTSSPAMVDAKARAEQLAAGDMTGVPQVQAPEEVQVGELGVAREMAPVTPIEAVTAEVPTAPEPVTVAGVERVEAPTPIQPVQMEAAQVKEQVDVEVASGEVKDEALAKAAQVERVAPIEAAEVEIPEGALTDRIVGVLSPESKAEAAQVAGTTLARVTRAKKQLRNAGLSEEDIIELGNDPEALEARLADFSEAQRGIIEGLPEEALVSNQLDSLLAGIEEGKIPTWAAPAVASVEAMLARRGLSASTVGRDALFNAIIQSAVPLAQANAQAIQASVGQQRAIEAQVEITNAQFRQQTALDNAGKVFQMDMAQFSADQQTALSNSKFLQTVGLTEAGFEQQAIVQNAVLMSQANLAEADFYQKAQIQNAQAFLAMDMQNLNNEQQANVLRAQQEQQRLLSNQAATNAARQFNAASENQTQQFMASLATQVSQYNASQANSMSQFNAQQINARQALEFQAETDLAKANAAMANQINQFNAQVEFDREKFNTANAQAIEQSNLAWRRQVNTINTAAANQVAMQNAQNAFNMSAQAQAFLWQELRDQADFDFRRTEGEENRQAQLYATALANETSTAENFNASISSVATLIKALKG